MRSGGRGRATLVFLLVVALGEFVAFAWAPKKFSQRYGEPLQIELDWSTFLLLSAVGVIVAGICAYRTWRGGARAAASHTP